ncbi:MAG TPA: glucuronate isomerase [Gemmatimonadales bacterium]|nr:glucuronate isomerase [Gemmatimonadales bacterium]
MKDTAPHEDRGFDPEPSVRRAARALYEETRGLPIISPHGHVDPRLLADNEPFPDPASLIVTPDHYILRVLYAHGVPLESLGVPTREDAVVETDPRAIWQRFAEHSFLFLATPTGAWLDHELHEVFGIRERLDGDSAGRVYDEIATRLAAPEFTPRALFDRFGIEALATTDKASDALEHHGAIRRSGWKGRVIPTFRPDAAFQIAAPGWRAELDGLARAGGAAIGTIEEFVLALEQRRRYFRELGATATDHGVLEPFTEALSPADAERLFQQALAGEATASDQRRFEAHLLMEMARLSTADGLVMQIHPGALRNHNRMVFDRFGPDRGGDIPIATEFTRNLRPLLNAYGNDPRFTLVLFTLDESAYSRELAPLAGHYPAVRLGAPWWFHDSMQGMMRFRARTTETAGIYKTAGFTDDTRAFCSIPARHDLSRRMDANFLGRLVARHVIGMDDARRMARALAYDLAKQTYKL